LKVIILLFLSVTFIDIDNSVKEKGKQVSEWSLRASEILWCRVGGGIMSQNAHCGRKTHLTVNFEICMN